MKPFKLQKQLLSPFTSTFHLENLFMKQFPQAEKKVRKIDYISTNKEISNDQLISLLNKWNKFQKNDCMWFITPTMNLILS